MESFSGHTSVADQFPTIRNKAVFEAERERAYAALQDLESQTQAGSDPEAARAYGVVEVYVNYLNHFGIARGWLDEELPNEGDVWQES